MNRVIGLVGVVWGALGVAGLLSFAIYRLTPKALVALESGLSPWQWVLTGLVCLAMAYSEGYKGFQVKFSPRTAARIRHLRDRPNVVHTLLAPLFAMGFIHSNRKTKITAFAVSFGVLILVLLVHRLDQPWRGIIDAGVVVGLTWGLLSLAWCTLNALTRERFDTSPELPG